MVQFEDFKNPFPALDKYQYQYTCFNDDIQGTGAVILAGIINGLKKSGVHVMNQRAVFMGAGSAGVGVAKQIVEYFIKEGLTEEQARDCFWFVDTKVCFQLHRICGAASHIHRDLLRTIGATSLLNIRNTSPVAIIMANNTRLSKKLSTMSSQPFSWVCALFAASSTKISSRAWQTSMNTRLSSHFPTRQTMLNAPMRKP